MIGKINLPFSFHQNLLKYEIILLNYLGLRSIDKLIKRKDELKLDINSYPYLTEDDVRIFRQISSHKLIFSWGKRRFETS